MIFFCSIYFWQNEQKMSNKIIFILFVIETTHKVHETQSRTHFRLPLSQLYFLNSAYISAEAKSEKWPPGIGEEKSRHVWGGDVS